MSCYVDVAVSNATFQIDIPYTYYVPDSLEEFAIVGARVVVPYGLGNSPRMGVILAITSFKEGLKEIIDIERERPILNDELMMLISLLKDYTLCTYDDAIKTILPKYSRLVTDIRDGSVGMKRITKAHLITYYQRYNITEWTKVTPRQQEILDTLLEPMTFEELREKLGITRLPLNTLLDKNLIEVIYVEKTNPIYQNYEKVENFALTSVQNEVYLAIKEAIEKKEKDTSLLYGVTGSGKTLIYFKLISDAIENGKQALLLVPEIALATQLIIRFKSWLGERVGVIHSSLSDSERQLEWLRIKNGECDLVVGTRSSVFVPLENIGIIIIDEEQEATYISEINPRYNTYSIAAARAKYHKAHLLLSSATPSIETYHYAVTGKYNFIELKERYMNVPLPEVTVVDVRNELLQGNTFIVSNYLKDEIDKRLEKKEQVILLINRRGYRTVSICPECKELIKCDSCDITMVYHKQTNKYVCHYCGKTKDVNQYCDKCGAEIRHQGAGTQRIEEELTTLFPSARIERVDVDSTGKKNSLEEKLSSFDKGEADIIVGTQMVAKGLDFKSVTLVGVLCIDSMMLQTNFRASERTFSLLTQVIGRSGRGDKKGEAIIQTFDPKNKILALATKQDYQAFYEGEIVSRKAHLYPPFCTISSATVCSKEQKNADEASKVFLSLVQAELEKVNLPIRILGPTAMRVAYVSDMFRFKITFKSRGDRAFRNVINNAMKQFYALKEIKGVYVNIYFYDDGDI